MRMGPVVLLGALALAFTCRAGAEGPPAPKKGVYWHGEWRRVSIAELIISAAVTARNDTLGKLLDGPEGATIRFEVPVLDHGARDLFRGEHKHTRNAAARLSDLGLRTLVLAPYVVDAGMALTVHRDHDVAAQLALIDFEVFTLAGMTQLLGSRLIGRARPYVSACAPGECFYGPYRSFLSGHAMATFTAAGLMCIHHEKLPLFGGGAPDTWACVWALSVASVTSTLRLVADEHWASDVLVGAGLGWIYGYYLPRLLHFHAAKMTRSSGGRRPDVTWLPTLTGTAESGMLGVMGTF